VKWAQHIVTFLITLFLLIFNSLDTFWSIKYIKFGPLQEANYLMALLLSAEPKWFIVYKLCGVSLCIALLSFYSNRKLPRLFLYLMFVLYSILMLWWSYVIFLLG